MAGRDAACGMAHGGRDAATAPRAGAHDRSNRPAPGPRRRVRSCAVKPGVPRDARWCRPVIDAQAKALSRIQVVAHGRHRVGRLRWGMPAVCTGRRSVRHRRRGLSSRRAAFRAAAAIGVDAVRRRVIRWCMARCGAAACIAPGLGPTAVDRPGNGIATPPASPTRSAVARSHPACASSGLCRRACVVVPVPSGARPAVAARTGRGLQPDAAFNGMRPST